jgi:sec-independent protein translocase protein TatA
MINSILIFLNLGGGEVFLIVLVVLLLFGPDKLPGLAKGLGKGLREINDAKQQIQKEIQKSTSGIREEIEKHASQMQSEIDKAGQSVKRQIDDVSQTVTDQGKTLTDTAKE